MRTNGFHDFVLCPGHRGNNLMEYFLNSEGMNHDVKICLGQKSKIQNHDLHTEQGLQVTLADTGAQSNDEGYREDAQVHRRSPAACGDGVSDMDIARLVEFHKRAMKGSPPPGIVVALGGRPDTGPLAT
jgi:glucose-1-phosphate cytidylyltransferase